MRLLFTAAIALALLTACRRDDDDDATVTPAETPLATATITPTHDPAAGTLTPAPSATANDSVINIPGLHAGGMSYGGQERTWRVYLPASLPAEQPAPLVIGLHGGTGSGEQFENTTGMDAEAEEGRFIAVYPDGTGAARTWNGGACCGFAVREHVDDVGFIAALIDNVAHNFAIDTSRVYAVGHSNGAIMAFRLACELSSKIAAIGAVAGSLEVAGCQPSRPVSVLLIHGDADQSHPLAGGEGPDSIAGVPFNSVAETMETMRSAMGCSSETSIADDGEITTSSWPECSSAAVVQLKVIAGGSHAWPGGKPTLVGSQPSQALNATDEVWRFVSQFSTP